MSNPSSDSNVPASAYDRKAALQVLDAAKAGVRGLVLSGATTVPPIFHAPDLISHPVSQGIRPSVPLIDLSEVDNATVVAKVRRAAAEWGLFLVTGHSVPPELAAAALRMVRTFHDADGGEGTLKGHLYSRDPNKAVRYNTNFDLFESPVTNWQDTLYIITDPEAPAASGELPKNVWDVFSGYAKHLKQMQDTLFGLLSEALGLKASYLIDIGCNQGQMLACHYYPPCPEPEHAIGMVRHSDWGFLTVLLQDQIGGLQVLHNDTWVDVVPIPGAFVVNLGDLLQMVSNDNFRSCEHRVVAKSTGPRVSIASIPTQAGSTRIYGPIKELLSYKSPPLYKETLASVYRNHCASVGLGNKGLNDFRV